VPITLALVASVLYGTADFLGGFGSRRVGALATSLVSQLTGLVVIVALASLLGSSHVALRDVLWGVAAGVTGMGGLLLLYRGLAIGPMSVVAPTTALCAMALPVVVGLALGERPKRLAILGVVLAAFSVLLISRQGLGRGTIGARHERFGEALTVSLLSGVLIAMFLVCFQRTSSDAGYWPLVVARLTSLGALLAGASVVGGRGLLVRWVHEPRRTMVLVALAGAIDNVANVCYTTAARAHYLSIIAPLASLYPAATVLLARYVLGEELQRVQLLGLAIATGAIVLMTR